jgi:DNA-binding winged helix-turn-helix (wHTH) protein
MVRLNPEAENAEELMVRGWIMLATILHQRGRVERSLWLANEILERFGEKNYRGLNGVLYLLLGSIYEKKHECAIALSWYQKAHAQFIEEHNWYYHLYVLYGYARLERLQKNFAQSYWFLNLIEKATLAPEFGLLRREVERERSKLEQEKVDLLIDSRKGLIKTRENSQVSLRKQHVLLYILEALSTAHGRAGNDLERGLSKAEIIEYVWKESYRPETHDNKLYYNINRLRKLIEPNVRKPQYLLNWKQGYRLAPGLRIHYVGGRNAKHQGERYES